MRTLAAWLLLDDLDGLAAVGLGEDLLIGLHLGRGDLYLGHAGTLEALGDAGLSKALALDSDGLELLATLEDSA